MNYYRITLEVADNKDFTGDSLVKFGSSPEHPIPLVDCHEFGEIVYRTLDKHEGIDYSGPVLKRVNR